MRVSHVCRGVVVAWLAWGCAPLETGSERGPDLVASLDVRVRGDTAELGLHVTNALAVPVMVEFATAQRYDFAVFAPDGREVWRWSGARAFAQVRGTEVIAPEGWLQYREQWAAGAYGGRYIAEARLTSWNRPLELRMEFEIPAR